MKKSGHATEVEVFLRKWMDQQPGDPMTRWVSVASNGQITEITVSKESDENYRVLTALLSR